MKEQHLDNCTRINVLSFCGNMGVVYRQKSLIMLIAWPLASDGVPHIEEIGANNILVLHVST